MKDTPSPSQPSRLPTRRNRVLLGMIGTAVVVVPLLAISAFESPRESAGKKLQARPAVSKLMKSEKEWQQLLTKNQYEILRQAGTEPAYDNAFHDHKGHGTYACAGCGHRLFLSSAKFDSGTGWPSFFQTIDQAAVTEKPDDTLFEQRTEVVCDRCDGHLGHVFEDGPQPTGLRYCINSASLIFYPENSTPKTDEP